MNSQRLRPFDVVAMTSVITVAVLVLAPGVLQARAAARQAACRDNFKQIGLAMHNYHDVFGVFPPGNIWEPDPKRPAHDNGVGVRLLPFIDQAAVYNSFNFSIGSWIFKENKTVRIQRIEVYLCPDDTQKTVTADNDPNGQPTNVAFSLGSTAWATHPSAEKGPKPEGIFFDNSGVGVRDIIDGTSQTVMATEQVIDRLRREGSPEKTGDCSGGLAEVVDNFFERTGTRWLAGHPSSGYFNARRRINDAAADCFNAKVPGGIGYLNKVPRSVHEHGVNVLMADGAVRFVHETVDMFVWQALNTRSGQEKIGQ